MFLAYLQKLNREEVVTYLKSMATIASIDGEIHQKEKEYFTRLMNILSIEDELQVEIMNYFEQPPELRGLLMNIKNPHLKILILQDAYMMAYIDGDFKKVESRAINEIIRILEIKPGMVEKVSAWAKEGVKWQMEGEKLLESSIFYEKIYKDQF